MKEKKDNHLNQGISLYGLIMIAVGSCIGAGVFLVPSQIAKSLPSPSFILIAWLLGGLFTLSGALTFAELGSRLPQTGGVYVFLKKAFGELTAFLYGWSILTVITSGALAALAIGFSQYFSKIIGLDEGHEITIGLITIGILTVINIFGVKISEWVASILTTLKLIGIGIIVIIGLFLVPTNFIVNVDWSLPNINKGTGDSGLIGGFAIALIGVLWSYGGWYHASFLAGEAKNAKKIVPKAMIIGTVIVLITYLLINWAYLEMLPIENIQNSKAPASDAISQYYEFGGLFIAILIAISIFGTMTIYTMSAPRIYFAMAQDEIFFKNLAKINPFYKTPVNAIIIQSVWAMFLILFWQTFSDLITYVVFIDWIFLMLGAITIFIFRNQEASSTNIYKTPLYPFIPIIFIITCLILVSATLFEKPEQAIAGLILMAIGICVFYLFKFSHK